MTLLDFHLDMDSTMDSPWMGLNSWSLWSVEPDALNMDKKDLLWIHGASSVHTERVQKGDNACTHVQEGCQLGSWQLLHLNLPPRRCFFSLLAPTGALIVDLDANLCNK